MSEITNPRMIRTQPANGKLGWRISYPSLYNNCMLDPGDVTNFYRKAIFFLLAGSVVVGEILPRRWQSQSCVESRVNYAEVAGWPFFLIFADDDGR